MVGGSVKLTDRKTINTADPTSPEYSVTVRQRFLARKEDFSVLEMDEFSRNARIVLNECICRL